MFPNQHVFDGGHVGKQTDILKGAGNAQSSDFKRYKFCDVFPVKGHLTTRNVIDASHPVEEGCLSGAVWADQTGNHTFLDHEIYVVDGGQAAKRLGNFFSFKEVHGWSPNSSSMQLRSAHPPPHATPIAAGHLALGPRVARPS